MPFCVYDHNRVDESPLSGVRNTLRNGSVGIRGESGRNDLCPCGSGKKYKRINRSMPELVIPADSYFMMGDHRS
ncbi:MAG: SEC-C metal-binding domain-containing protein, partial [Candidatus Korobacteraceae bacterium]